MATAAYTAPRKLATTPKKPTIAGTVQPDVQPPQSQTFAQMQAQGMARPAPAPPAPKPVAPAPGQVTTMAPANPAGPAAPTPAPMPPTGIIQGGAGSGIPSWVFHQPSGSPPGGTPPPVAPAQPSTPPPSSGGMTQVPLPPPVYVNPAQPGSTTPPPATNPYPYQPPVSGGGQGSPPGVPGGNTGGSPPGVPGGNPGGSPPGYPGHPLPPGTQLPGLPGGMQYVPPPPPIPAGNYGPGAGTGNGGMTQVPPPPPTYTGPGGGIGPAPGYQPNQPGAINNTFDWGQLGQMLQTMMLNHQAPAPFVPGTNSTDVALEQQIRNALTQPSAYNSDILTDSYNRLNAQLSQGYDVRQQQLAEEMARRGIDASSIHGGRLSDLYSEQARAQADLAGSLLQDQARTYATDRANAINQAMGYGNQQYNQDQSTYNTNQNANQQDFNQLQSLINQYTGFGQQQFENQYQVDQFNAQMDLAWQQLLMQLLGQTGG